MNTPLSDPGLPSSAKVIWIICRRNAHAGPLGPGAIEARSGLTRHTVLRGIARLVAAGWGGAQPGNRAFATTRTATGRPTAPAPGPTGLGRNGVLLYPARQSYSRMPSRLVFGPTLGPASAGMP